MSTFTLDEAMQSTANRMVTELSDTISDICGVMVRQHKVPENIAALVAVDIGLTATLYGWAALHMAADVKIGDKAAWLSACEKAFDDELPTLLFGEFMDAAKIEPQVAANAPDPSHDSGELPGAWDYQG